MQKGSRPVRSLLIVSAAKWPAVARLPALYKKAGWQVSILADPAEYLWASGYVDRRFALATGIPGLPSSLSAHLEKWHYDRIIVGDEPSLLALAREPERFYAQDPFPVPKEKLACVTEKSAFTHTASALPGLIPQTRTCTDWKDLLQAVKELGYPVIVKPSIGFGGKGVRRFENVLQLEQAKMFLEQIFPVVVQVFIIGRTGSSSVYYHQGKPFAWIGSYKTRVHPEPFGPSCVREVAEFPELEQVVDLVGRVTEFDGFAGIGWIREEKTGRILVLEFAPRVVPDIPLAGLSGVDFSKVLDGDVRVFQRPRVKHPVRVYMFPQHLVRCIEYGRWLELRFWIPGWGRHDIPWEDPCLLIRLLVNGLGLRTLRHLWRWIKA